MTVPSLPRQIAATASAAAVVLLSSCDLFTDAATRLAYDIESKVGRLGTQEGARHVVLHRVPSKSGECTGPYKVQFDKVGALVVWCFDAAGATVSSHSTSYHNRFASTADTFIVDKAAGVPLSVTLERRAGRAVIVSVE